MSQIISFQFSFLSIVFQLLNSQEPCLDEGSGIKATLMENKAAGLSCPKKCNDFQDECLLLKLTYKVEAKYYPLHYTPETQH